MLNWNAELQAALTRALREDAGLFSRLQEAVGRGFFVPGRTPEHTAGGILGELGEDSERLTVLLGMLRDAGADCELLSQIEAAMCGPAEQPIPEKAPEAPAKPTEGTVITDSTIVTGDVGAGAVVGAGAQGAHSQRAGRDLTIIEKQVTYNVTVSDGGQLGAVGDQAQGRINNGPRPKEAPNLIGLLHDGTLPLPPNPADRLPSQLLQAAYEVVPFVDRPELGKIAMWCATEAAWSVRLFTGEGGSGKTRLLIEACKRQRSAGWSAGFLWDADRLPDDACNRVLHTNADRLVVLDYAETRRPFLKALLKRATAGQVQGRLRLVLLARNAGDWWDELKRTDAHLTHHLTGAHHRLAALFTTPEERPARFEAAAKAMAEAQGKPVPSAPEHDGLHEDVLGQPLYLWMAALAALQEKQFSTAKDLLNETLNHEQRFWWLRLKETGWALELGELEEWVGPVVAGVTLLGGIQDRREAVRVLKSVRSIPKRHRKKHQSKLLKLLRDLYPGEAEHWLMGLQPDVLGEHLVARYLSADLVVDMLSEKFDKVSSVLTTLNRLAKTGKSQEMWLKVAFGNQGRLDRYVSMAMEVAIETGDPIGMVLAEQLKETPLEDRLDELYACCPNETVALMEVATVLSAQRLRQATRIHTESSPDNLQALINCSIRLTDHSNRLSNQGDREGAFKFALQATNLDRELASRNPGHFQSFLAASLNNLGNRLDLLGRREDALAATQEAVELYRTLAKEEPDAFLPDLAAALNNLGIRLGVLGRREDALAAVQEAVELYRALAKDRPDAFRPNLAGTLNNLGNRLDSLGRREDALVATQEAVSIRRAFAKDKPDAFLPDLATALNNLGIRLDSLGRREDALVATQEAVELYRTLAKDRPDAFLSNLAGSLNNLGGDLDVLSHREEALATTQEAIELYRTLAKDRPDVFLPNLAGSLHNLGVQLDALGRREEALVAVQEAIELYRAYVNDKSDTLLPDLAGSLNSLGNLLDALGHREEALAAVQEAVELYRALAKDRPDAFSPALSRTINTLGGCLSESNQPDDAWSAYTEALQLLSPYFLKLPQAFTQQMQWTVNDYIKHAPQGQQPDTALTEPILAKLKELGFTEE